MLNIEQPKDYRIAVHHLGFRPFFLLASVFAVLSMLIWSGVYHLEYELPHSDRLPIFQWHAHEMIYGYAMAVIAGFLLTAVRNWTGMQTINGIPLLGLALCWLLARVMPLLAFESALSFMALFDLLFITGLIIAIFIPIYKAKHWGQLSILAVVVLLLVSHVLFYLGIFGILSKGMRWGLYSALYLIILLIFLMGRRVIPFFIEKGIDGTTQLVNRTWLDVSSLLCLVLYIFVEVFTEFQMFSVVLAMLLAVMHSVRLFGWYHVEIWRKPLLWSLYLSYVWLIAGFILKALSVYISLPPLLFVHAFTYGGIGLMTLSMMARVSLGHTGRNVFEPPKIVNGIFWFLLVGSVFRVIFPVFFFEWYPHWIGISQLSWILSFAVFVWVYTPMLIKPRIDGRYG